MKPPPRVPRGYVGKPPSAGLRSVNATDVGTPAQKTTGRLRAARLGVGWGHLLQLAQTHMWSIMTLPNPEQLTWVLPGSSRAKS